MLDTLPLLRKTKFPSIRRSTLTTLQVNLGYKCNQSCVHCHVNAGPKRTEMMNAENIGLIVDVLRARSITQLDLTGGAPELHEQFRELILAARKIGVHIIDRCNLTILFEPGQEGLAEFLADNQVEVVASLPCYSLENVDKQRGKGVFDLSIAGLQKLNALGYAQPGSNLMLNLVYNPQGPSLPPNQLLLEADYKYALQAHFGIQFNALFTLANVPIKRFGSMLLSKGQFHSYMKLLQDSYSAENLSDVMCRKLLSIDWRGYVYDCDFNQQLDLELKLDGAPEQRAHLRDLLKTDLRNTPIRVANHCFACTAGQGSSCGGAL